MAEPVFAAAKTQRYVTASQPQLRAAIAKGAYASGGFTGTFLRRDTRDVLPRSWGVRQEFTAVVTAKDTARAEAVIIAALAQEPGEPTVEAVLTDFFAAIAETLLNRPVAYREIVLGHIPDGTGTPSPICFRLLPVPAGSVATRFARPGKPVQYVPSATAEGRRRRSAGFVELDPDTLAAFRLPPELERRVRRGFAAIAAAAEAAQAPGPGDRAPGGGETVPSLTEATAVFGWNGSTGPLTWDQLQPFHTWRHLEHLAFKIKMREAILACLNQALHTAGRRISMPMSIALKGVTSLAQVRQAQDDLRVGRKSLQELDTWSLQ